MMQTGNSQSNVQTRPHGCIDLEKLDVPPHRIAEIAGMLIGKNGSGIRRYTSAVNGSFVKLQTTKATSTAQTRPDLALCRFVYISARTIQDLQNVAMMVNRDVIHYLRGYSVQPSRPTSNVNVFPLKREIIGFVIGSNGDNLKRIQRFVGDECFIVYDANSKIFRITANTTNACRLAECRIAESIREFSQRTKKPQTQLPHAQVPRSTTGSRYECIAGQSDSDDEDSLSVTSSLLEQNSATLAPALAEENAVIDETKPSKKARKKMRRATQLENQLFDNSSVSSNGSIANIRAEEQERKIVRENLSKTRDRAGNLQYPDVDFWDNKTRRWVKLTGPAAVSWDDVDQEIARRRSAAQVDNTPTPQMWQPDTDINPANHTPVANGCWSSPSTNLWDSNGVEEINAEEYNQRRYKTHNRRDTQKQYYDDEIPLDLLELTEYYDDCIDLTDLTYYNDEYQY